MWRFVTSSVPASVLDRHGWVPATAGNLSHRLRDGRIAITRSGCHKGFLTGDEVIAVDAGGAVVQGEGRPSAETLLHTQIIWPNSRRRQPCCMAIR